MSNPFFMPEVADARFVRMYFFRHPEHGPSSCALVTGCRSFSSIQYAHVLYVYERGDIITGRPSWAVTSEVNRMAEPGSGRSHFLCTFSDGAHHNLGPADDWADLETFAARALELVAAHYALPGLPEEIPEPTMMVQEYRVPMPTMGKPDRPAPPPEKKKRRWPFGK